MKIAGKLIEGAETTDEEFLRKVLENLSYWIQAELKRSIFYC